MRRLIRGTLVTAATALILLAGTCSGASAISVTATGPEETVFDYTTMSCFSDDYPDGPAQVFRDATGQIQFVGPRADGRRILGPDFNHLTAECAPHFPSVYDTNPAHYNYSRGVAGTYTVNGRDVYALVHNEFHGWEIPGFCPAGPGKRRCGSGGITYAVSHDSANTWVAPDPPNNFVATVPPRPTIDDGRTGMLAPTNPIKKGNYWYSVALLAAVKDQDAGACTIRTPDITDPTAWRGWDGTSFSVRFQNPYYERVTPQSTHTCEPVSYDSIMSMSRSLTYSTYLNKYVLTGSAVKFDPALSRNVFGFYFSTSDDLVNWSPRQLLMEMPSLLSHTCGGPDVGSYPSLIDHSSSDPNFRITGAAVYVYFVRIRYNAACQLSNDRDLVRIPIQFSQ